MITLAGRLMPLDRVFFCDFTNMASLRCVCFQTFQVQTYFAAFYFHLKNFFQKINLLAAFKFCLSFCGQIVRL